MIDKVKSQLEHSDQYSKPGPNFHEKNGPGGPLFLDQNFCRTKMSVTDLAMTRQKVLENNVVLGIKSSVYSVLWVCT